MHAKSDSEVTSLAPSSPRSPRRPLYYVQSPSQHDAEKMSFQSSPMASPSHHHFHYHCSPIHHSRESSTTRFSASLKNPKSGAWKKMLHETGEEDDEDDDGGNRDGRMSLPKFYFICFVLCFVVLFTAFSLILWGASKPYKPKISLQAFSFYRYSFRNVCFGFWIARVNPVIMGLMAHELSIRYLLFLSIVFESFNIQAGIDGSGVPTKMLSLNSTVRISFRNPATFFGVHVSSTPITLYYYQLKVASGNMKQFYQSRKSQRMISTVVHGSQIPLYGGGASVTSSRDHHTEVPLNLTFVIRSRAYVLGRLVKPKFYSNIHCSATLGENLLGKQVNLKKSCLYD